MNKDQLLSLTLRQLRQEASKLSVPLYSRKTKAVLVDLILIYQEKSTINTYITPPESKSEEPSETNTFKSSEEVKTNVVFLPRDPDWAYVFWQISDADRDYKVELGYKYGFIWMSLAFSSISHVPGSHPSEQILDKFVPFNLDSTSESIPDISNPIVSEQNGMHERLYQAATNIPLRRKVGSEEFMENLNSTNLNDNLTDSGAGKWSSGLNESGSGILKNRSFWLVADAELIVYGATEPSANLTIGGEDVPLAADGTFRIQVPFRDGTQNYAIKAVDVSGELKKSISMKFDRTTPLDDTNEKDNAETEWF